jgi:hypothetical protein
MRTLAAVLLGSWAGMSAWAQPAPTVTVGDGSDTVATIVSLEGDVDLIRLGLAPNTKAKMGDRLRNADQLTAISADAEVQLDCVNGASQVLVEGFDAFINPADATSKCAVDLKKGTAVATSNPDGSAAGGASIRGGPVAADSQHTQFGITVPPGDADGSEAFVIQGKAAVRRAGTTLTLTDGQLLSARTAAITTVSDARYQRLAASFARIDTRGSGVAVSAQAKGQLTASYYNAFKSPRDASARKALEDSYAALAIPKNAVVRRYNAAQRHNMAVPAGAVAHQLPAVAAPAPAAPVKPNVIRRYHKPSVGSHRVDACLNWGTGCGAPAAEAFCKSKGFARATSFELAYNIGAETPTLVLGDNKVCNVADCDGFSLIVCQ